MTTLKKASLKIGGGLFCTVFACLLLASCGGSGVAADRCEVGGRPLLHRQRIPDWVIKRGEGGPPVVLACFGSPVQGPTEMVGFENVGPSYCVTFDTPRSHEVHGELCTAADKTPAGEWCAGKAACVKSYAIVPEFTELSGPVSDGVASVKVTEGGSPAQGNIKVLRLSGPLLHRIHADKPFGFFIAFLPGCVPPNRVKVLPLGKDGKKLGRATRWDSPVPCANP